METTALTFGAPLWLWGLAALPVLAGLHWWSHRRGVSLISRIVAPRLLGELAGSVSTGRRAVRAGLLLLAFGLLFIALAKPRTGFVDIETKSKGRDVLVAIDTSRSMLATDVAPTRLARAKLMTQDLLRLVRGDRVGLIAFAGSAFLQAPLTLDYSAVLNSLEELDTTVIPKGGTNIAAAIQTAEQAFGKAEGTVRALVILTDGEELDADGIAAAKRARDLGIRIFTVGIGSPEGSLIPIRTPDGRQDFVRDSSGKPVQSRLDATRLAEIAEASGGFYVPLGVDTAREIVQNGIEPIERTETGSLASRQPVEAYRYPLTAAILVLVVWMLLGERKRTTTPRLAARAAFLVLLPCQAMAGGLEDFQSGNYSAARVDFEARLKSSPEWREMQFNAGAAAYKLDDFEQAISHFTKALLAEDTTLRAKASYNLANSLVRRGEKTEDRTAKKADWTSAIEHYTETLKLQPENTQAKENREIVKKLLEELDREQKQDQQDKDQQDKDQQNKDQQDKDQQDKDQQNKDQQNKDQQDKDQQNKDQQNKDQQNKDQQNKDQQDKDQQDKDQQDKDQQDKDQQDKDQQDKDQQDKDQQNKEQGDKQRPQDRPSPDGQPSPTPAPTPGEKKEGELKSGEEPSPTPQPQPQGGQPSEPQEKEGEMSAAQARALLNSLRSEEEKVNLMQQQTSQDVLRDW